MATSSGVATDATDLWNKFITFITTNATLVGLSEDWSVAWSGSGATASDRIIQGPGLSGTDEINIGMRLHIDVPADEFWIELRGMTGIIPSSAAVEDHINVQPKPSLIFLDNSTMDYWFVANGRRFIIVIKVSTVFESCYAGFFLPYATPTEYPHPLFVGGTAGPDTGNSNSPRSWREDLSGHSAFPWPYSDYGGNYTSLFVSTGAYALAPDVTWMDFSNYNEFLEGCIGSETRGTYIPSGESTPAFSDNDYLSSAVFAKGWTSLYGGGKYLMPIHLFECTTASQTLGVLQGVYKCQGDAMSSEDIITVGATNHLVVQNVFRVDYNDYFAVEI